MRSGSSSSSSSPSLTFHKLASECRAELATPGGARPSHPTHWRRELGPSDSFAEAVF